MIYKFRLRYRRFEEYPKINALPLIISTTSMDVKPIDTKTTIDADGKTRKKEEGSKADSKADNFFRFVRIKDRLFKVEFS